MPLDYSEKNLVNAPLAHHRRGKRTERLQMYAFFTGVASTLISLATVIVEAVHK